MTAPSWSHEEMKDRVVASARAAGWRTRREVTGALWRADIGCYRDGACVIFEVQVNDDPKLPRRHYERLHTGAWCFWFARRGWRRQRNMPVFDATEIERRVAAVLSGPVPLLAPSDTPIEREPATVDSARIILCRVCSFPRRLIGYCWRCGFAGGPHYRLCPESIVAAMAADFSRKIDRLKRTPVAGVFAEALEWREHHQLVGLQRVLEETERVAAGTQTR